MAGHTNGSPLLERLIARTALRDQAAFKELYDRTVKCLFALILRLLRDKAWAEDVLQDAYVGIWNSAPGYSPAKSQPMTWLMAVARNKALDALRSTTGERATIVRPVVMDDEQDAETPDVADESAGPLERLIQGMDATRLRQCLLGLEAPQRQAIGLAFYDGMTHMELAVHLKQPLGTVKAWVRRGLERLKGCLAS